MYFPSLLGQVPLITFRYAHFMAAEQEGQMYPAEINIFHDCINRLMSSGPFTLDTPQGEVWFDNEYMLRKIYNLNENGLDWQGNPLLTAGSAVAEAEHILARARNGHQPPLI